MLNDTWHKDKNVVHVINPKVKKQRDATSNEESTTTAHNQSNEFGWEGY